MVPLARIALAVAFMVASEMAAAQPVPQFKEFPARRVFVGRNAAPDLSSRQAWTYRTRIREAARRRPNFAGRYIVATWGCGTECETGVIVDAASGRVVFLPNAVGTPADADEKFSRVVFRLDSRLIVLTGMINEEPPMGSHFYVFDGERLSHLRTVVRQREGDAQAGMPKQSSPPVPPAAPEPPPATATDTGSDTLPVTPLTLRDDDILQLGRLIRRSLANRPECTVEVTRDTLMSGTLRSAPDGTVEARRARLMPTLPDAPLTDGVPANDFVVTIRGKACGQCDDRGCRTIVLVKADGRMSLALDAHLLGVSPAPPGGDAMGQSSPVPLLVTEPAADKVEIRRVRYVYKDGSYRPASDRPIEPYEGVWIHEDKSCDFVWMPTEELAHVFYVTKEGRSGYEWSCEAKQTKREGWTWTSRSACAGEGDEWREVTKLTILDPDSQTRLRIGEKTFHRCEVMAE